MYTLQYKYYKHIVEAEKWNTSQQDMFSADGWQAGNV